MCALLRDIRGEPRSPFPTNIPADSVITFHVKESLIPDEGFNGLDDVITDEMNTVITHVYGNFISVRKSSHIAHTREGHDEMEYIFYVPAPTSWEQLDSLILQLEFTCEALLDIGWCANFFVNWRGDGIVNNDLLHPD